MTDIVAAQVLELFERHDARHITVELTPGGVVAIDYPGGCFQLDGSSAVTLAADIARALIGAVNDDSPPVQLALYLSLHACRALAAEAEAAAGDDAVFETFTDNLDRTQAEGPGPRFGVSHSLADWPEGAAGVVAWFVCGCCANRWAAHHGGMAVFDLVEGRRLWTPDATAPVPAAGEAH